MLPGSPGVIKSSLLLLFSPPLLTAVWDWDCCWCCCCCGVEDEGDKVGIVCWSSFREVGGSPAESGGGEGSPTPAVWPQEPDEEEDEEVVEVGVPGWAVVADEDAGAGAGLLPSDEGPEEVEAGGADCCCPLVPLLLPFVAAAPPPFLSRSFLLSLLMVQGPASAAWSCWWWSGNASSAAAPITASLPNLEQAKGEGHD